MNNLPQIDKPVEGFYKMRLARAAVFAAVRLVYGPPPDPWTGEPLDRSWRWMAWVDGELHPDPYHCWIWCARYPISEEDYHLMLARSGWAKKWSPDSPEAEPRKAVDWLNSPPVTNKGA